MKQLIESNELLLAHPFASMQQRRCCIRIGAGLANAFMDFNHSFETKTSAAGRSPSGISGKPLKVLLNELLILKSRMTIDIGNDTPWF